MSRTQLFRFGLSRWWLLGLAAALAPLAMACSQSNSSTTQTTSASAAASTTSSAAAVTSAAIPRAAFETAMAEINHGACKPGQKYKQQPLREPVKIKPHRHADGSSVIKTELVVSMRERCVPVWVEDEKEGWQWQMQTLKLRTYGFPRDPKKPITEADADKASAPNAATPNIAWSAPGPTFVMHPASKPGASDGTRFMMTLYNRMPHDGDPMACEPIYKCNKSGPNAGIDPATGRCKEPIETKSGGFPKQVPSQKVNGKLVEPPNCFHGKNSTNFHFHGFHVSPQLGQDFVGLELRPPKPKGAPEMTKHSSHGEHGVVKYGHFDFNVDPLRYTQAPGTHWYHAHKHGSTALHVLNGQVGTFEIRGEFDRKLQAYFAKKGGGKLRDRLMVVQQLQERQPGLGGVDQNGSVLINGQGNPIVKMKKGEIQRWRFVGATMQASAALRIGFPVVEGKDSPKIQQIAMDGVQFSPDNYKCQPFLNNPDCTPKVQKKAGKETKESSFDELTTFELHPGNRADFLVQAPSKAGTYCLVHDIKASLDENRKSTQRLSLAALAKANAGNCGLDSNSLGPLLTLVVEDGEKAMTFPSKADFPKMPGYLADIPEVTDPKLQKAIHYEMVNQTDLDQTQFWINQEKYNPDCANETLTIDKPERWTLWNNSYLVQHPFHIHQNPFQLIEQSDRATDKNQKGRYTYPVWRDTLAIPTATKPSDGSGKAAEPNSDPVKTAWGHASMRYVAKEFTGSFVNHCHILGHEDRGMMHNTQASCADGKWATTAPVAKGAKCGPDGFCPSDCQAGKPIAAAKQCATPPAQTSDWPAAYGYPAKAAEKK